MGDEARAKAEARIDRATEIYDRHGVVVHVLWVGVAVVLILGGLAMTVLPGPAVVVVPAGLAMLAVVFGWARRLLLAGADEGADAWEHVKRTRRWVKVLSVAAVVCAVGGVLAWFLL
ncbi:MAG: PGPGW domain-containing protein [Actinobacteria bacterium]|nr:PGPGW domain-containing protein [Actinomycetota bacterium]